LPLAWAGMPKTSFRKNSGALATLKNVKMISNLSLAQLLIGNFKEGWKNYECRAKSQNSEFLKEFRHHDLGWFYFNR
jgi:hypothetical protein